MAKHLGKFIVSLMFIFVFLGMYQCFGYETISRKHHPLGVVAIKKEKLTGNIYKFDCSPVVKGCMVTKI